MAKVIGDQRLLAAERDFLRARVVTVIEERIGFASEAVKARPSVPATPP